jgi:hypothetical protein
VLVLVIAAGSANCAHRSAARFSPSIPPAPPRIEPNAEIDHTRRADAALDRLRRQLHDRAGASPDRAAPRPTDAGSDTAQPERPLGTTWNVVISQTPNGGPSPRGTMDAARAPKSESSHAVAPVVAHRTPHRALDVSLGLIGGLCAALAVRKRIRRSGRP